MVKKSDEEKSVLKKPELNKRDVNLDIIFKGYNELKRYFHSLHSLIVVNNGTIIFEKYNTGLKPIYKNLFSSVKKLQYIAIGKVLKFPTLSFKDYYGEKWNIRAVTKCILSLLIGIAIEKGYIESLDQRVLDFFPEYTSETVQEKKDITIKHLLTHTSGLESIKKSSMSINMLKSKDWIRFILNLNLEAEPGERYMTNPADCHLLSGVLSKASNMSTLELANKHLFEPLNIKGAYWEKDPSGFNFGGGNLFLSPEDMAKIGLLILRDGTINGNTIVLPEWIDESVKKVSCKDDEQFYGYYWRISDEKSEETGKTYITYTARGANGQCIYIIPSLDIVMISTGRLSFSFDRSYSLNKFVKKYLIPSIEEKC